MVFSQIDGLQNNPAALRKRLHYLINVGVRADEKLPQIGQQVAAHYQEPHNPVQSNAISQNAKTLHAGQNSSSFVVPELDLGGLNG